jgi:streptogramin lyase
VVVVLVAAVSVSLVAPRPAGAAEWGDIDHFGDDDVDGPRAIAVGPDGNLWFSNLDVVGSSISRVTPEGDLTHFPLAGHDLDVPLGIAAGPGSSMYFTSFDDDRIGRITTAGTITSFDHPGIDGPDGITTGPDGNVWFASRESDRIGRLTPQGITMFAHPDIDGPSGITAGPDGNVWFTTRHGLGRITPAGQITVFEDPSLFSPAAITTGPDGALWFVDPVEELVGRFTVAGELTTFQDPRFEDTFAITTGPDGNLWFTDSDLDLVGSITTAGVIRTFDATGGEGDGQQPLGIAAGPDDDVWFVAVDGDQVARIRVCGGGVFSDVALTHPFRADVCWMGVEEISTGYDDGTFRPSAAVTRQAMSAFMYRLAGEPPFVPGSPTFSDVGTGHPFFADIEWMAFEEISTGYEDDTFRPSAAVTRQAMSAFMYRLAGEPPVMVPSMPTFDDVGTGHPFFEQIEFMAEAEISTGYDDGTFRPSAAVSRQAMSAFMRRLAEGAGVDLDDIS